MGIFFNALTLILGFGILVLSNFNPLIMFGLLIALTMVISCTATPRPGPHRLRQD